MKDKTTKASCNKMSYESKKDADKDVKQLLAARKHFSKKFSNIKSNKKFNTYKCPRCGDWHLTSQRITKKQHMR